MDSTTLRSPSRPTQWEHLKGKLDTEGVPCETMSGSSIVPQRA